MKIELYDHEFRAEFLRFAALIGANHWQRRVSIVRQQIKNNRLLREQLESENSIAIGLALCEDLLKKFSVIPSNIAAERGLHPAMTFAAQTLSIIEESSPTHAKAWIGRVQGALKNSGHMRGLRLELTAATHFSKRGNSIVWAEQEGIGTFDLLVEDIGPEGLEVECKSVSTDKGRKVHRQEAIEFHSLLEPTLASFAKTLQVGLAAIVTIPDRLPELLKDRRQLAQFVVQQILSGQNQFVQNGTTVRVVEFEAHEARIANQENVPIFDRTVLERVTGTNNRAMMIIGGGGKGFLVIVLQSKLEDEFLVRVFETVAESAKRQVSKSKAAHYFVGLEGIGTEALKEIAELENDPEHPPTPLRRAVSDLLGRESYDHIVGIGLLSRAETIVTLDGIVHSGGGGTVYNFPKRESRFWHDDFGGMFS